MKTIHFVTYANGNSRVTGFPFAYTQKILVDSIQAQTKRKVVLHTHNLETVKNQKWFNKIEHFPNIEMGEKAWARDGYFNSFKALIIHDLLDKIDEGDYIYYTDSSAYAREPFMQNLDRFFDYVDYNGHICGSHGNDFMHRSFGCLSNQDVWKVIWPESEMYLPRILSHTHILNSWFCFKNTDKNRKFIKEWSYLTTNVVINEKPIITIHHTVDQSLFNVLVYKYGFGTFFNNTKHDDNKNHNNIHKFINNLHIDNISELNQYFPKPINYLKRLN